MNNDSEDYIWIFHGANGRFASGAFVTKELAYDWIKQNGLTGILTRYPINIGVYQWSIAHGYFRPNNEHEFTNEFIQKFTSASMEHYHFENGK